MTPSIVNADELDDISIQVIGLDEIPENALERIPLPDPDFGNLNDIHQNIILNQSSKLGASEIDAIATIPAPPGDTSGLESPQ